MKKFLCAMLALSMMIGALSCCAAAESKTVHIVTTIFPIYDWTSAVTEGADNVEVTMLLDNGVDLHSYQPTVSDIMKIATCDLFIYVGGESDEWVEDALEESVNRDMCVINLLTALGSDVKMEEIVEGMEHDHDEDDHDDDDNDHDDDHDDDDHDDPDHDEDEADEHVWLSLRNAGKLTGVIAAMLSQIDPANAALYTANAQSYTAQLDALDQRYADMVNTSAYKTVLFGDRFPFRYLVDDYGLDYYAAFAGCSAETEASFQTIVFLSQKVDELGLPAVLTIEGTNHKIAETIISATKDKNQKLLAVDSMQGTTAKDIENGASYLTIMESNLDVFAQAIN